MDPSDRLKHLKLAQDEFDRRINAAWSNVKRNRLSPLVADALALG
jgi:hypothetical protein